MAQKARQINWDELAREAVRPGVERCGFRGEQVLMVMNYLQPGMDVRPHSHPFEQIAYIVKGKMKFIIGDDVHVVEAGGVIHIPADVEHCGEPIGDELVMNLDIFSPIRDDYRHLVADQQADFEGA